MLSHVFYESSHAALGDTATSEHLDRIDRRLLGAPGAVHLEESQRATEQSVTHPTQSTFEFEHPPGELLSLLNVRLDNDDVLLR